jgi:hypothetical protein
VRRILPAAPLAARPVACLTSAGARRSLLAVRCRSDGRPPRSLDQNHPRRQGKPKRHFLFSPLSLFHRVGDGGWRSLSRRPRPMRPTARQPSSSLPFPVRLERLERTRSPMAGVPPATAGAHRGGGWVLPFSPFFSFPSTCRGSGRRGGWHVLCPREGSLPFGGGEGVSPHRPCSSSRCLPVSTRLSPVSNFLFSFFSVRVLWGSVGFRYELGLGFETFTVYPRRSTT